MKTQINFMYNTILQQKKWKWIGMLLLYILLPNDGFSQSQEELPSEKKEQKVENYRPTYLNVAIGFNSSNFRDFATSPLIYRGVSRYTSLERLKMDSIRESKIGAHYAAGSYSIEVGKESASSQVKTIALYYSQLYDVPKIKIRKWNFKAGGLFNTTANLRQNPSLQNNATGIEIIGTLFGSVKATKDISRNEVKHKKFIFINYQLKPRKRKLSYQLNVGLMNNTYRNGFVYAGQAGILNKSELFDDYEFKVFSGFRMSSSLDYTILLKNKNRIQLSYLWDAYKTGGDLDKFEMASHIFRVSLLFNTK